MPDPLANDPGTLDRPYVPSNRAAYFEIAAVGLAEAVALALALYFSGSIGVVLAIHLVAIAALAWIAWQATNQRRDTAIPLIALITGVFTGPAGAIGSAVLGLGSAGPGKPNALISAWYDRIALSTAIKPEERLCEDVSVGRTLDLSSPIPDAFPTRIETGSLAERQAILGHIARHFHADYLPVLRRALESPEPVLRVQAAAVAAHVTPNIRRRLRDLLVAPVSGPLEALDRYSELSHLSASGLVDETERHAAEAVVRRLGDDVVANLRRGPLDLARSADPAVAAKREQTLDEILVTRQHFAWLRSQRGARRLTQLSPNTRLRRIGRVRYPTGDAAA